MPGAARRGDACTGHGPWPGRPSDGGSPNVFVNGRPKLRQGDAYPTHCDPHGSCHAGAVAVGSATVFVNGRPAARVGDAVSCGGSIAAGSGNVIIGG
jgi:uncharacterized Zn-binding protein involved in type VI secretion